jgi:flagellar biosynthesis protein FliQ
MTEADFLDVTRAAMWASVVMSAPILGAALVFVPKTAAMLAVFWLSMGFMTATLVAFFQTTVVPIVSGGR